MFSPLNIIIRPSRIKCGLYLAIHIFAVICVFSTGLSLHWQLIFVLLVLLSAIYEIRSKELAVTLHWDITNREIKFAIGEQALQQSTGIADLYLIFGMLYLNIKRENLSNLKLLVFPDSVDKASYRRLRVAARWASINAKAE